jgi:hypothetical protein
MTLIDTNDRWLLKLPSALPIVSFIPFARALEDRLSRRTPILPIGLATASFEDGKL